MSINSEYFIHGRAANDSHPLIEGQNGEKRTRLFYGEAVDLDLFKSEPLRLRLGKPVPKKPVMVDFHSKPDPVISQKLCDVLAPKNLYHVQFIPATVEVKGTLLPYWYVNNYNWISCIDEKQSVLSFNDDHDIASDITKLVLDEGILAKIPLEQRLYFVLRECCSVYLMHQSIKDEVLAAKPEGIRFWPVADWSDSSDFSS